MIRHLCNRFPDKEWSGVLFYTVEGSFEDGLTVECKDICLMDIGTATYTEFDTSPDIAGYIVTNNLLDCHLGLIHSHDSMPTFFSGTDTSTLQEEGSYKNNFVSLIVNNEGKYTAAITRHVYSDVNNDISYTYQMFGDGPVTGKATGTEKWEYIEYFMMNVIRPDVKDEKNPLDERIDEILEKKKKTSKLSSTVIYGGSNAAYGKSWIDYYSDKDSTAEKQMSIPWTEKEFTDKPLTNSKVNQGAFKVIMARLLTSSMTCNAYHIDLNSWLENYDKVYSTKFDSVIDYSEWLSPYLEYLMDHIPGTSEDIVDETTVVAYADAMIKFIGKPKGRFTKELLEQLSFYGSTELSTADSGFTGTTWDN